MSIFYDDINIYFVKFEQKTAHRQINIEKIRENHQLLFNY